MSDQVDFATQLMAQRSVGSQQPPSTLPNNFVAIKDLFLPINYIPKTANISLQVLNQDIHKQQLEPDETDSKQFKIEQPLNLQNLKGITKNVYSILKNKKSIKYKTLCRLLLSKLSPSDRTPETEQKEGQIDNIKLSDTRKNLKRRLYDAINVMIAIGAIKKYENRLYIHNSKSKQPDVEQLDYYTAKEKIKSIENSIKDKKQYLRELKIKKLLFSKLVHRNIQQVDVLNGNKHNLECKNEHQGQQKTKLELPLVLLHCSEMENMTVEPDKFIAAANYQNRFSTLSDADALGYLFKISKKELQDLDPTQQIKNIQDDENQGSQLSKNGDNGQEEQK